MHYIRKGGRHQSKIQKGRTQIIFICQHIFNAARSGNSNPKGVHDGRIYEGRDPGALEGTHPSGGPETHGCRPLQGTGGLPAQRGDGRPAGLFVHGLPMGRTIFGRWGDSGHILVFLEGACTRAHRAGKEAEMAPRAEAGFRERRRKRPGEPRCGRSMGRRRLVMFQPSIARTNGLTFPPLGSRRLNPSV